MPKLAVISSHPIQYNAPFFKLLTKRGFITVKIFYTWSQSQHGAVYDPGFGRQIEWDIPLLQGYDYTFVKNTAKKPGTHHFYGIINPSLNEEIEKWYPDAILVFGWAFKSHLSVLKHFHKKIPVLFRGDSTLLGESPGIKLIARTLFLKWVYKHIDYALYVGTNNKKYYLRHGLKEQQLFFAPHAIDNDRFSGNNNYYEQEAFLWRQALGIKPNEIAFLFAGKLEPNKNAEFLIKAFNQLPSQSNVHLIIVGNGYMEKKIKQKYSNIKRLHFIDFQNQTKMPIVYRIGDVFVLPSKGPVETWGLAINEAMACSRAILVSDRCGAAIDLVNAGANGFIFKNNDLKEVQNKMQQLIKSKEQISKMGKKSFEIVQDWTFENICIQVEELLKRIGNKKVAK